MTNILEVEELVGTLWHRLISRNAESYPDHDQAAVTLAEMQAPLGVLFRALGGDLAVRICAVDRHTSHHRLSLRQRLGLAEERLALAELGEAELKLPPRLALYAHKSLNRELYLWLAAWCALAVPPEPLPETASPLLRDLIWLRAVRRTDAILRRRLPGLADRRRRLYGHFRALRPHRRLPPLEAAVEACVLALLGGDIPGADHPIWPLIVADAPPDTAMLTPLARGYRPFLPVPLWGEVSLIPPHARADRTEDEEDHRAASGEADQRKRRARRKNNDQAGRKDPLALNRFEKILSVADMVNVNRAMDDDEEDAARQAADDLDQMTLSPNGERPATKLRFDLDLPPDAVSHSRLTSGVVYPEWDFRTRSYLPDHCRVLTGIATGDVDAWRPDRETRRQIRQIRRQFEALRPKRTVLRGQLDGAELDLEAVVRARCDLAATGMASNRLYLSSARRMRDLSVALLVDVSLSTDAWIDNRRILDVEKQALSVFSAALEACGDDYGIFTFTSRKRDWVRVETVKGFDEAAGPAVRGRIAGLTPGYYTRMGAAIRHVSALLAARPHQHRLLLLLTDGKPNDVDHYDGRYGLEDSRKAVTDARALGLSVFGVTIDKGGRDYIPYLFGPGGYGIVERLEKLPTALPKLYRQLLG